LKKYDAQMLLQQQLLQQQQQKVELVDIKTKNNGVLEGKPKLNIDTELNGRGSNGNGGYDDEKGPTWFEDLSNTSSV
jgi:hypothetical protein